VNVLNILLIYFKFHHTFLCNYNILFVPWHTCRPRRCKQNHCEVKSPNSICIGFAHSYMLSFVWYRRPWWVLTILVECAFNLINEQLVYPMCMYMCMYICIYIYYWEYPIKNDNQPWLLTNHLPWDTARRLIKPGFRIPDLPIKMWWFTLWMWQNHKSRS
jgi:hypothetical protein